MMYPKANGVFPPVYPISLLDGCILNLDMQDTGSKLIDQSGRSNHGVNNGSTPLARKYGYARSFDGVDDWVNCGASSVFNLTTAITIEGWVNLPNSIEQNASFPTFISKDSPTARSWSIWLTKFLEIRFFIGGISSALIPTVDIGGLGWTYVAVTYNGESLKYYINGLLDNSASYIGNIDVSTSSVRIATGYDDVSRKLKGMIDGVRIWNVARTQAEIKVMFQTESWKYGISV